MCMPIPLIPVFIGGMNRIGDRHPVFGRKVGRTVIDQCVSLIPVELVGQRKNCHTPLHRLFPAFCKRGGGYQLVKASGPAEESGILNVALGAVIIRPTGAWIGG